MMPSEPKIFRQETLDTTRRSLVKKFSAFDSKGFYLAGGTGLSLLYGHRQSIDFDFFCPDAFDVEELSRFVIHHLGKDNLTVRNTAANTLHITKHGIKISFMTYTYPLIKPLIETKYFFIASIEDIACMKMTAIQGRAVNKDYVDLYSIIKKFGLKKLLKIYSQKYGNHMSESLLLKYLTSFEDINIQPLSMNWDLSWEEVKNYLQGEVKNYTGII